MAEHGHMCPGQVLGVRMGILGLELLGYGAPLNGRDVKNVLIWVEIDRCATDALTTTTGVRLGRRSLKFVDFGLMAATFHRISDGLSYRIEVREDCRQKAAAQFPHLIEPQQREVEAYQVMSPSDLFRVHRVRVEVRPEDMPGWSESKAYCQECGAVIRHRREVVKDGRTLCPVCAGGAYFEVISPVEIQDEPGGPADLGSK